MVTLCREARAAGDVPLYVHPDWRERFPWLVQGTTARGADGTFDLGLFGSQPVGDALRRWHYLREALGFAGAAHSGQRHGTDVLLHHAPFEGLLVSRGYDGHATRAPAILLAVSVADCVPVFLVDPAVRAVAALHAGWRGVAGGMLAAGLGALRALSAADPAELHVHFGPAICGACYEVGPEVHAALRLPPPGRNAPVDLRGVLAAQAAELGIPESHTTASSFCTRCGESPFFSHRGGCAERQMGVLGIRAEREA